MEFCLEYLHFSYQNNYLLNFSFSFFLVFFYLVSLCDLKSYIPVTNYNFTPLMNEESGLSFENDLNNSLSDEFELILDEGEAIIDYDYFDMPLEASFIIYSVTDFVYNQILENLLYFKSVFFKLYFSFIFIFISL